MFKNNKKITIEIEGMKCEHCKKNVEELLLSFDNVLKTKVDLEKKKVTITYKDILNLELIKLKIEEMGYKVVEIEK